MTSMDQEIVIAQGPPPPAAPCRYVAASGRPCGQPVVEGLPFCAMHVQKTQDAEREARYLQVLPVELRGMFKEQLASGDIKDLSAEVAAARVSLAVIYEQIEKDRNNGTITVTREQRDAIRDALNTIRGLVETQAKVKPDQVITIYEMRVIIGEIVGMIGQALDDLDTKIESIHRHLPADKIAELRGVRTVLVRKIQNYAREGLTTRAMTMAYGAPPPKPPS
jgi:hypothetical protein